MASSKYCKRKLPSETVSETNSEQSINYHELKNLLAKTSLPISIISQQNNLTNQTQDCSCCYSTPSVSNEKLCFNENPTRISMNKEDLVKHKNHNYKQLTKYKQYNNILLKSNVCNKETFISSKNNSQMNTSMSLSHFNSNLYPETSFLMQKPMQKFNSNDKIFKNNASSKTKTIDSNSINAFNRRQSWRKNKTKRPMSTTSLEFNQYKTRSVLSTPSPNGSTTKNSLTSFTVPQLSPRVCKLQMEERQWENIKNNLKSNQKKKRNNILPIKKSVSGGTINNLYQTGSNNRKNSNDESLILLDNRSISSVSTTINSGNYYSDNIMQQHNRNLNSIHSYQNTGRQPKSALKKLNSAESHFQRKNRCSPQFNFFIEQRLSELEKKQEQLKEVWMGNQQHQQNKHLHSSSWQNHNQINKLKKNELFQNNDNWSMYPHNLSSDKLENILKFHARKFSNLPQIETINENQIMWNDQNLHYSSLSQSIPLFSNIDVNTKKAQKFSAVAHNKFTSSMNSLKSSLTSLPTKKLLSNNMQYSPIMHQKIAIKKINSSPAIKSYTHLENTCLNLSNRETYIGPDTMQYINFKPELLKRNLIENKKKLFQKRHIYPHSFETEFLAEENEDEIETITWDMKKESESQRKCVSLVTSPSNINLNTNSNKNYPMQKNLPNISNSHIRFILPLEVDRIASCIINPFFVAQNSLNNCSTSQIDTNIMPYYDSSQVNIAAYNSTQDNEDVIPTQYHSLNEMMLSSQRNLNTPIWELQKPTYNNLNYFDKNAGNFNTENTITISFNNSNCSARKNPFLYSYSTIGV